MSLSRSGSDAGGNFDQASLQREDNDIPDGGGGASSSEAEKVRQAVKELQGKMEKTMTKLRQEQADKEENVQDYLAALVSVTDKHQQEGLKAIFEKRNNKTSQSIWQLQRKLEAYERKVSELQRHGSVPRGQGSRQPKEVLKDVSKGLQ
jgi:hypothetical protein